MAYAALMSLHSTFRDLVNSSHIHIPPKSGPILLLAIKAAKSLRDTTELLDLSSMSCSRKNVNALDERIKEAVWRFEDLLDSHVYDQIFNSHRISEEYFDSHPTLRRSQIRVVAEIQLDEIRDDIESFTKELEELKKEYIYELENMTPEEEVVDVDVDVDAGSCVENCKMVIGSSYYLWKIRSRLQLKHSLDVISLVGMGGIGKTALAKKLFSEFEFECRAWVTIGRKWQPRDLGRDILAQLEPSMKGDDEGVLKDKRCLIVLDDVWDYGVWDHTSFETDIFGTTLVLVTTRLDHVARFVEGSFYLKVELLTNDESWDLLRQRVFGEEDCPPELEKAGKKIAEECDGLPLMIVTVADLLCQAKMTAKHWESVAQKNSPVFITAYDRVSEVLFPSYEYLPQRLKSCFLYMGLFPQSYALTTSGILDMWIAEGFLCRIDTITTIEKTSEIHLADLCCHNVVIICHTGINYLGINSGRQIKSSRLQSAFWHLCKREATKSKFSHILSTLVDVEESMISTQRRLSFHNNILLAIDNVSDFVGDVCASTARSLIFKGPYDGYPVPICFNLRLLKVLDASHIRFYEFPMLVFHLLYLRFLALVCNTNQLPASISKLWHLQFLNICQHLTFKHFGVTSYMPIEIWDMKQLKHLSVSGSNLLNPSSDASLESLLKIEYVGVETCTKEVLERIPNLKKLSILVHLHPGDDDDMKVWDCLNHVHVLRELTSLTCKVWNPILTRSETIALPSPLPMLPSSLNKLHLDGTGYPWSYMGVIGSLPHLRVLKLGCYAFRGSEWVVKDGQFQTLNVLLLKGTDLVKFKVEVGGFIVLRRLIFSNCYKLRDIQWGPDQSSVIEVIDCSTSTVEFANTHNSTRESHIPEEHRVKYVRSCYMK